MKLKDGSRIQNVKLCAFGADKEGAVESALLASSSLQGIRCDGTARTATYRQCSCSCKNLKDNTI